MAAVSVKRSIVTGLPPTLTRSSGFVIESDWSDFGSAQRIMGKTKSLAQPGNRGLTTRSRYFSVPGIVELPGDCPTWVGKGKVCNLRAQQVAHSLRAEALRSFRS